MNPQQLEVDLQDFKKELLKQGLFRASALYYWLQVTSVLALPVIGFFCLRMQSSLGGCLATILFAFFYPQMAFLGHDFAHFQIFRGRFREANTFFGNYIFGALLQGFCYSWWQTKHTAHHQHPNSYKVVKGQPRVLDTDLDTAPLIVWHQRLMTTDKKVSKIWLRWQRIAFPLLLIFSRISWAFQNLWISATQGNFAEFFLILVHYSIFYKILTALVGLSAMQALAFWLVANMAGGALLAWIFVLNHTGKEIIEFDNEQYGFDVQVRTTRNVTNNWWTHWLTGGLNLQIEHHLFPTLPRHQLPKISVQVKKILQKNGYRYESAGFFRATKLALASLPRKMDFNP